MHGYWCHWCWPFLWRLSNMRSQKVCLMSSAEASKLWPIIWRSPRQKKAQGRRYCIAWHRILAPVSRDHSTLVLHSPESVSMLERSREHWKQMHANENRKINVVSSFESLPPLTFTALSVKCPWRRPEDGEIYRSQRAQSDMVYCSVVELGFALFILNSLALQCPQALADI